MKKQIVMTALLLVVGLGAIAAETAAPPKFWIMPTTGIRGSGSFKIQSEELDYSAIRLDDGFAYGLTFGYRPSQAFAFEAVWSRLGTSVQGASTAEDFTPVALFKAYEDQLLANLLVSTGYTIGTVKPFFLLGVGVTSINPRADVPTVTHFAWNLGFGLEALIKGRFGLRLQGKFVPTYVGMTDVVLQEWNGGVATMAVRTTMTQWELQAGLFFRF